MKKEEYNGGAGFAAAGMALMMVVMLAAETLADSLRGWLLAAVGLAVSALLMRAGQRRAGQGERG